MDEGMRMHMRGGSLYLHGVHVARWGDTRRYAPEALLKRALHGAVIHAVN